MSLCLWRLSGMLKMEVTSVGRNNWLIMCTFQSPLSGLMRVLTLVLAEWEVGGVNTRKLEGHGNQRSVHMAMDSHLQPASDCLFSQPFEPKGCCAKQIRFSKWKKKKKNSHEYYKFNIYFFKYIYIYIYIRLPLLFDHPKLSEFQFWIAQSF